MKNAERGWVVLDQPQHAPSYEEFHPRPPKSGKNVVFEDGHVAPLDVTADVTPTASSSVGVPISR